MTFDERLCSIRELMSEKKVDFIVQKLTDPHITEYVNPHYKRISWVSGFTGSNATIVISKKDALLWTDNRYYLQASKQLSTQWTLMKTSETETISIPDYLRQEIKKGDVVGLDYSTTPISLFVDIQQVEGIELLNIDLFDLINPHELELTQIHQFTASQLTVKQKIDLIRNEYPETTVILTALDDIAYVFNIRANDVPFIPLALSYSIISPNQIILFAGTEENSSSISSLPQLRECDVKVLPYNSFFMKFKEYIKTSTVRYSQSNMNSLIFSLLSELKIECIENISHINLMKSIRLDQEIKKMTELHRIDSVSLCQFFGSLYSHRKEVVTECDVADYLETVRRTKENYCGPSFDSIIGNGPNAAIVHYKPEIDKCSKINWNDVLLCDVGGQYSEGATTDVTRTVHYGAPDEKIKRAYTRVLQGHIDLHLAVFDKKTPMKELDHLARDPMSRDEMKYGHGTGHGVGYYLMVHECPPSFRSELHFECGQTISIEPGIYLENEFGIRIENVVLVVEKDKEHFGFKPLTLVPYCLNLIDISLLSEEEIQWLNNYNEKIKKDVLCGIQEEEVRQWVEDNTKRIN